MKIRAYNGSLLVGLKWSVLVVVLDWFLVSCYQLSRSYEQQRKKEKKMSFSIYEREELASYIPVTKLFLRSHPSASGGVQPPCSPAGCPTARCRSGEVCPVRCCFGLMLPGNTRLRVTLCASCHS